MNIRYCLLPALLGLLHTPAFSQAKAPVTAMDFVKIKHGRRAEALYYFENNWKVYRDAALKKGYITSYSILATPADSAAGFELVLITEYADSVQYNLSEARFEPIIKELRPNGPKLLNQVKPNDFRQNVFFKRATTVVHSAPRRVSGKH